MKVLNTVIITIFLCFLSSCAQNKSQKNIEYDYQLMVSELQNPWGFTFLPDNSMLINEKSGELIHFKDGKKTPIKGLPAVEELSQGGLMDIELHPNYAQNGWIYITYATSDDDVEGVNTALMRFKLNENQIINKELLYKAKPDTKKGVHFGSRIVFDTKGYLYFTVGDRGQRDKNPQDITKDGGKVYRLHDDGAIPKDNPFVDNPNAKKAIYSYGHRNPQGMARHPETGKIWAHEHGPRGGDEINIIQKGKNYGWPLITYGINYSGTKITDKTHMQGMEQPLHYWTPSIAPSGMAFVSSDVYPELKGGLLSGSLSFEFLNRSVLKGEKVIKEERLLNKIGRVRSIEQGPDGYIYVGVENKGIVKLIKKK